MSVPRQRRYPHRPIVKPLRRPMITAVPASAVLPENTSYREQVIEAIAAWIDHAQRGAQR